MSYTKEQIDEMHARNWHLFKELDADDPKRINGHAYVAEDERIKEIERKQGKQQAALKELAFHCYNGAVNPIAIINNFPAAIEGMSQPEIVESVECRVIIAQLAAIFRMKGDEFSIYADQLNMEKSLETLDRELEKAIAPKIVPKLVGGSPFDDPGELENVFTGHPTE